MPLIRARLIDAALTSFQNFSSDQDPYENLTPSGFTALRHLSKTLLSRKQI